jgi:hypothetical protein
LFDGCVRSGQNCFNGGIVDAREIFGVGSILPLPFRILYHDRRTRDAGYLHLACAS